MKRTVLLSADRYLRDLTKQINKATTRVNMIALVIAEDDATRALIDALCRASERGVRVNIGMDLYFTFKEIGETSSRLSYFRQQTRAMRATKRRLEKSGAKVRWLGQYGFFLLSRRTHTKWTIVDNVTYSFGGVNMHQAGIQSIDYMLKINNRQLSERMSAEHDFVITTDIASRGYPSHTIPFENDQIIIDGGKLFDSAIYNRAVELAKESTSAIYVSQYCPTGTLAHTLGAIDTTFYFNTPKNVHDLMNRFAIRFAMARTGIRSKYRRRRYLHAKCIIFTRVDGQKVALTGSHNFVELGGVLGTREVALETMDKRIIAQLERFISSSVARSR